MFKLRLQFGDRVIAHLNLILKLRQPPLHRRDLGRLPLDQFIALSDQRVALIQQHLNSTSTVAGHASRVVGLNCQCFRGLGIAERG